MIDNQIYLNEEEQYPIYQRSDLGTRTMIRSSVSGGRRFIKWLESEGLAITEGGMPLTTESVLERYSKSLHERHGLEPL